MKLHLSLHFWCAARGTEGAYFQDRRNGSSDLMMKKQAGPPHCPLVTVDSITKPSAAAPAEIRSDVEDETRAEKAKKATMAVEAHAAQGQ